jgi:uncharacterized DUF497 family protein
MDFIYKNRFIWDTDKAETNPKKHPGITFEDAADAFDTPVYIEEYDKENSTEEDLYNKTLFAHGASQLITVSYTEREDLIRIFSARKVNARENKAYETYVTAYYGT